MAIDQTHIMQQIRYIMESNDPNNLQYMIPTYKLLHSSLVKNSTKEVNEELLSLLMDTCQYFVNASKSESYDSYFLGESLGVYMHTVIYLRERAIRYPF